MWRRLRRGRGILNWARADLLSLVSGCTVADVGWQGREGTAEEKKKKRSKGAGWSRCPDAPHEMEAADLLEV